MTNGIQINLNREGKLTFGIVTDMGEVYAKSRADYDGHGVLVLDFGFSTWFATSERQLLGQGWFKRLKRYDALISMIVACQQRAGHKPRDSRRYRETVTALRGFLRTDAGSVGLPSLRPVPAPDRDPAELRMLNPPGQVARPGRAVRDHLHRGGGRRHEPDMLVWGGYLDNRNRRNQKTFVCFWCGYRMHVDFYAAANIEARRVRPNGWLFQRKAAVPAELVCAFGERRVRALRLGRTGSRGVPAGLRLTNPCFGGMPLAVVRSSERRKAFVKSPETQALVAA